VWLKWWSACPASARPWEGEGREGKREREGKKGGEGRKGDLRREKKTPNRPILWLVTGAVPSVTPGTPPYLFLETCGLGLLTLD
jgi:hypothetical protein